MKPENNADGNVELVIATHNAGKVKELTRLLGDLPIHVRYLSEWPQICEVEETGETFAANASLKAREYAARTKLCTLADDSGLEVTALGGAPGIFSARYAGTEGSDSERIVRLLDELKATGDSERRARFVCVIALAQPTTDRIMLFTGICDGRIADAARGDDGFGYDPIFVPDGYTQTFGELSAQVKQQISHRALALQSARDYLWKELRDIA
jgi:XTP/dITP diphosphohydrolase